MFRVIETEPDRFEVRVRTNAWLFGRWYDCGEFKWSSSTEAMDHAIYMEEHYIKMRALPRQVYHSVADRPECCHCPDCTIHNNKPGAVRPFIG